MSRFIDDVEQAIALARRSRKRALRTLDVLERRRTVTGRPGRGKGTTRIAIALSSLSVAEPLTTNVALNLNRRVMDR
jgi:hypothetical protein